jgi:hypothetical protein
MTPYLHVCFPKPTLKMIYESIGSIGLALWPMGSEKFSSSGYGVWVIGELWVISAGRAWFYWIPMGYEGLWVYRAMG